MEEARFGLDSKMPEVQGNAPWEQNYQRSNKMTKAHIIGFLVSVVAAIPVTYLWSEFLHKMLEKHKQPEDTKPTRIRWVAITMGVVERLLFTVFVGWSVSGAAGFIGSWILVKQLGGWNRLTLSKNQTYGIALFFIGLLGNAMSLLFGLVGGLIILSATGGEPAKNTMPLPPSNIQSNAVLQN